MVYWLFVPLVLSVGILVYVYTIQPQGKSSHLFALFMLCTALNAIALFATSTVESEQLALWISAFRYLIAFSLADLLFWFLVLELVFRTRAKPQWVQGYTVFCVILSIAACAISLLDHTGQTALFYGPLEYVAGRGYVFTAGPLYLVPQIVRLIITLGALGVLVWVFSKGDRSRQISLGLSFLALMLMPLLSRLILMAIGYEFTGLGTAADFVLALGLGYAVSRNLFAPVEIALRQVVDSMLEGLIVLDTGGHVLRVNQAAEKLLTVAEQQVLYSPYPTLFASWESMTSDRQTLDPLLDSIQSTRLYNQEIQIETEHGHQHIDIQISPVRGPQKQTLGSMILLTDVTAIRNREEHLEKALADQQQLTTTVAELSSPVLPVMEHVIVLPLVGTMDTVRATLFLKTLLSGIKTYQTRTAILDLTGVPSLGTETASVLLQATDGAQLLGAEPVLVGIQPEVAEVLGELSIDLRSITVLTDLQAGLQYAAQKQTSQLSET